jgi:hypothetical protein
MTEHRVAMWSGPRNISTAMMRAWENRDDTVVEDEPLYGYYLERTGIAHPGAAEVIASQGSDWRAIIARLKGDAPGGARVYYQKHMTHHLLPELGSDWLLELQNCFLIRDPALVAASYARTRPDLTADDLGFRQQAKLFEIVSRGAPGRSVVIDADDLLRQPRQMLERLCAALSVPFSERMLSWPAGARASDGVWAKYWYASVERSTGFGPPRDPPDTLSEPVASVAEACRPYYEMMYARRLRVA